MAPPLFHCPPLPPREPPEALSAWMTQAPSATLSVAAARLASCRALPSSRAHTQYPETSQLLSIMVRLHVVSCSAISAWFSFSQRS